jgi:hypothetical protein
MADTSSGGYDTTESTQSTNNTHMNILNPIKLQMSTDTMAPEKT